MAAGRALGGAVASDVLGEVLALVPGDWLTAMHAELERLVARLVR